VLGALGLAVSGVVRDRGRKIEPGLWGEWGGSPTIRRLRWRGAPDQRVVRRLHDRIAAVLDESLPTMEEETSDQADADRRYEDAIARLRERTRNTTRYRLVFEENVEYGFRRNSLGIRPIALIIAAVVLGVCAGLLVLGEGKASARFARWGSAGILSLLALAYWTVVVTKGWVRRAAELYADRLFEALETLRQEKQRP
jgi:hypothetical protein